jgi:hypothetical protein
MSIASFSELKTAIASFTHRADLSSYAADFITLADNRIHYGSKDPEMPSKPLRVKGMEQRESSTVGTDGTITLPTGYLETRRIVLTVNGKNKELKYRSPALNAEWETETSTGSFFTENNGKIYVGGTGGGSGYLHDYYKKLDTLSDSQTTNWLITNHPSVYLQACLLEAWLFVGNMAKAQAAYRSFAGLLNGLNSADKMAVKAGSGLAVTPDTYY